MEKWKHLHVVNEQLPPLLIKATFRNHGYSIKLTDLSRIWVETMSKDETIVRARKRNCSIDPGEDSGQYKIFLNKLQSSLDQDSRTNLAISATNDGKLKLHLEAALPSPLPTFEWEVSLERTPDSTISTELVSPLLHRAHNLNHRMELLIAEIQAKDKIIAKITDRLENSGHDLTAVFPGVSNVKLTRNKSQQEQLARHIRGLGKFDEETWNAQLDTATSTDILPESLEDAIFASLTQSGTGNDNTDQAANWWEQIPEGRHIDLEEDGSENAQDRAGKVSKLQRSLERQDTSDVDVSQHDDFQKQATPPHLRSHSPPTARQDDIEMGGTSGHAPSDEDSTEDEDDLDKPLQKQAAPQERPLPETIAAEVSPQPQSPSLPPALKSTKQSALIRRPFTHEDETDEDDEDDLEGLSQPSQKTASTSTSQLPSRQKSQTPQPTLPATTKSPPRKPIGKLGALRSSPSEESTPPLEEEPSDLQTSTTTKTTTTKTSLEHHQQPKPKAKLGTIGGIKAKAKPQPPSPPPAPAPAASTTRSTAAATVRDSTATLEPPVQSESSRKREEVQTDEIGEPESLKDREVKRADAKREALKRELEEKARAPVKKKRKF